MEERTTGSTLEGHRAALLSILKTGSSSTLDVINGIKQKLPRMQALLPPELKIQVLGDQSIFVRAALSGVVREAATAARLAPSRARCQVLNEDVCVIDHASQ